MSFREENFTFQDGETFHLFSTMAKQKELHCHNCLELDYIQRGSGTYMIGGKLYPIEPGDIFIINNSELHLAISNDEAIEMTVLVFDAHFLRRSPFGADYLKLFLNRNRSFSNRITEEVEGYEDMIHVFSCMKKESVMITEAAANLLLALLYQYYSQKKELKDDGQGSLGFSSMQKVFSYINEHFSEKITLDAMAEEASLSKTYLSKSFKKFIGQSLFEYIQQTRVQYAGYLLKTSQESVTQIALDSGFETVSYFNRVFKKYYHMSPGQFRKEYSRMESGTEIDENR